VSQHEQRKHPIDRRWLKYVTGHRETMLLCSARRWKLEVKTCAGVARRVRFLGKRRPGAGDLFMAGDSAAVHAGSVARWATRHSHSERDL
jgi:hypothetical protein